MTVEMRSKEEEEGQAIGTQKRTVEEWRSSSPEETGIWFCPSTCTRLELNRALAVS